jgi:hypothetical protein
LKFFKNSPSLLITTVLSEYEWLPWKFDKCPQNFWDNIENQRNFTDWAGKQLNIKEMSDWYKITQKVNKQIFFGNVTSNGTKLVELA